MHKWTFSLLLAALCTLPLAAQTNHKNSANTRLQTHVERRVTQAQAAAQAAAPCHNKDEESSLSIDELIEAEEELSLLRSRHDPNATFQKYPYLLDPSYRRTHNAAGEQEKQAPASTTTAKQEEPLDTHERIEAEEELALLRNRVDNNATFEGYPFLLDPSYRRASQEQKQIIRRKYTQPTWATKVGL